MTRGGSPGHFREGGGDGTGRSRGSGGASSGPRNVDGMSPYKPGTSRGIEPGKAHDRCSTAERQFSGGLGGPWDFGGLRRPGGGRAWEDGGIPWHIRGGGVGMAERQLSGSAPLGGSWGEVEYLSRWEYLLGGGKCFSTCIRGESYLCWGVGGLRWRIHLCTHSASQCRSQSAAADE